MSRTSDRVGTKAEIRKKCQGQNPKNIVRRVRARFHSVSGYTGGSFAGLDTRGVVVSHDELNRMVDEGVALPIDQSRRVCDLCGHSVRVKKDGGLFKHTCI